jgi:hypothetical protein
MKNKRILAYQLSQKLTGEEIKHINAAGGETYKTTNMATFAGGVDDMSFDVNTD